MSPKFKKNGSIDKRSKYYKKNGMKMPEQSPVPAAPAPKPSEPSATPMTARHIIERIESDTKTLRTMLGV